MTGLPCCKSLCLDIIIIIIIIIAIYPLLRLIWAPS